MARTRNRLAAVLAAWFAITACPALAQDTAPGVTWDSLSAEQQLLLGQFRDGWGEMPPGRQQEALVQQSRLRRQQTRLHPDARPPQLRQATSVDPRVGVAQRDDDTPHSRRGHARRG